MTEPTVIHSSFLTHNDIDFITNSLYERVNVLFASIKDDTIIFVNPYNANYFIYDTFSQAPLATITKTLGTEPSTPFDVATYTEQLIEPTIQITN